VGEPAAAEPHPALLLPAGTDEPQAPQVRMAPVRYLGFAYAVLVVLVLLHSSVVMRGYISYVGLLAGALALLGVLLLEAYAPGMHLWGWLKYVVYELPNIYISMHGYLFLSVCFLLIWLVSYFWGDRLTYIEVSPSQVRVVQQVGEGESVYDATTLSFEKRKDDIFRHKILGLGLLHVLGLGFITTGAGDLIFRTAGAHPEVIEWPNVMNVHRCMQKLTRGLATREVTRNTSV
jgi:hypothetical protein